MTFDPFAHGYVLGRKFKWNKSREYLQIEGSLKKVVSGATFMTENAATDAVKGIYNSFANAAGQKTKTPLIWRIYRFFRQPFIKVEGSCGNTGQTSYEAKYGNRKLKIKIQGTMPDGESVLEKLIK